MKPRPSKQEEARKAIRAHACLVIPDNHEYKLIKDRGQDKIYECIHCKEWYVPNYEKPQS